jgi:hypothetical protein
MGSLLVVAPLAWAIIALVSRPNLALGRSRAPRPSSTSGTCKCRRRRPGASYACSTKPPPTSTCRKWRFTESRIRVRAVEPESSAQGTDTSCSPRDPDSEPPSSSSRQQRSVRVPLTAVPQKPPTAARRTAEARRARAERPRMRAAHPKARAAARQISHVAVLRPGTVAARTKQAEKRTPWEARRPAPEGALLRTPERPERARGAARRDRGAPLPARERRPYP